MKETDTNHVGEKVVNIDYLRQLSRGNMRFVDEMIKIFLAENPEEMKVLASAIARVDYDLIKAAAHKLRSTLPYIGLDKLVEREINEMEELAAARKGIDRIAEHFDRVKEMCERAYLELQPV